MKLVEGDDLDTLRAFLPIRDELPVFYERLPFYERGTLLSFGKVFVIAAGPGPFGTGGHQYLLNGAGQAILQANKTAGLVLTAETAPAYLKFFCRFLWAEGVRFEVIESIDGYAVIELGFEEKALSDDLRMVGGPDGKGGFLYRAMMRVDDWVYGVQLAISGPLGEVSMSEVAQLARLVRLQ